MDAPKKRSIFALDADEAVLALPCPVVIEDWLERRFRRGYIGCFSLFFARLLGAATAIALTGIPYFLSCIARTHTTYWKMYDMRGPGNFLALHVFHPSVVLTTAMFLYSVAAAFRYRKRDHVRYVFHMYIFELYLMAMAMLSVYIFSLLMIPSPFPGFRIAAAVLLTSAVCVNIAHSVASFRRELLSDTGVARREAILSGIRKLCRYAWWFFPIALFFRYGKGREIRDMLTGFFALTLPLSAPLFIRFLLSFTLSYFMPKYPSLKSYYLSSKFILQIHSAKSIQPTNFKPSRRFIYTALCNPKSSQ